MRNVTLIYSYEIYSVSLNFIYNNCNYFNQVNKFSRHQHVNGINIIQVKKSKTAFSQLMYFEVHSLIIISQLLESVCLYPKVISISGVLFVERGVGSSFSLGQVRLASYFSGQMCLESTQPKRNTFLPKRLISKVGYNVKSLKG